MFAFLISCTPLALYIHYISHDIRLVQVNYYILRYSCFFTLKCINIAIFNNDIKLYIRLFAQKIHYYCLLLLFEIYIWYQINNFPLDTLSCVQFGDLKLQTCSFRLIDNDKIRERSRLKRLRITLLSSNS